MANKKISGIAIATLASHNVISDKINKTFLQLRFWHFPKIIVYKFNKVYDIEIDRDGFINCLTLYLNIYRYVYESDKVFF